MTDEELTQKEALWSGLPDGPWEYESGGGDCGFRYSGSIYLPAADRMMDQPLVIVNGRGFCNNARHADENARQCELTESITIAIAQSRTDVPALCADVKRLRKALQEAIELVEDVADTSYAQNSWVYRHKLAALKAVLEQAD